MPRFDNLLDTLCDLFMRYIPQPIEPGLHTIGQPTDESPVLLTTNNRITLNRIRRALDTRSAYVLALDLGGLDFRSAAAAGKLRTDRLIAAFMTSGLRDHAAPRRAFLPPFCESLIDTAVISDTTGWDVCLGPADARDLRQFLEAPTMFESNNASIFDWHERLAIALSTSLVTSAVFVLPLLVFGLAVALAGLAAVWLGFILFAAIYAVGPRRLKLVKGLALGLALGAVSSAAEYWGGVRPEIAATWLVGFIVLGFWWGYSYADPFPVNGASTPSG